MAFETMSAAQHCREYLGIKGITYTTVNGYVDGNVYAVTISSDYNKVEFSFETKICGYQYFNTLFQSMEWDEDEGILTISSSSPEYSFDIYFPEP